MQMYIFHAAARRNLPRRQLRLALGIFNFWRRAVQIARRRRFRIVRLLVHRQHGHDANNLSIVARSYSGGDRMFWLDEFFNFWFIELQAARILRDLRDLQRFWPLQSS